MTQDPIRHFIVLSWGRSAKQLSKNYFSGNLDWIAGYIAGKIYREDKNPPFSAAALPSADVRVGDKRHTSAGGRGGAPCIWQRQTPARGRGKDIIRAAMEQRDIFAGSSPDIAFAAADPLVRGGSDRPHFFRSKQSRAPPWRGFPEKAEQDDRKDVNVVVVTRARRERVGAPYGADGRSVTSTRDRQTIGGRSHGMMIAHNILKVAPEPRCSICHWHRQESPTSRPSSAWRWPPRHCLGGHCQPEDGKFRGRGSW